VKHIHCRPYQIEDMVSILRDTDPRTHDEHITAAETVFPGPAFSFFCGEELVCCAGVTLKWCGCGEAWVAPAKCWGNYKREIVVWTRKVLDDLQKNFALRRLQAVVVSGDGGAERYIEHFNFKEEGKLREYDALGRDCKMYSRLLKDMK
jgi:hypothetical protein